MEIPKGEIRVYYKHKDRIVEAWDLAIENVLFAFGIKRWASGFDLTTGTRDLAFRPMAEKEYAKIHG